MQRLDFEPFLIAASAQQQGRPDRAASPQAIKLFESSRNFVQNPLHLWQVQRATQAS